MPLYEYRCKDCGETADHVVPIAQRNDPIACPSCKGESELLVSAPIIGTEVLRGDSRIIKDERQLPQNWRDEGTTGKPGGAGRTIYFH